MNNPIIKRYSFSLFRRNSIIVTGIIYFSLVMLINSLTFFYFVANMQSGTPVDVHKLAMTAYPWMLGLSVILFWGMASLAPANIIFSQIIKGSYDFFEILPISGRTKATGLLVGTNLLYYPLAVISIILTTQYGILGGIEPRHQLYILMLFISVGLFFNTLSVLVCVSSTNINKKRFKGQTNGVSSTAGIFILFVVLGMPLIGVIADSEKGLQELLAFEWNFYSLNISAMLLISFFALYFASWNFTGAARKLQEKTVPMFSRSGAVKYLISLQSILFGFFFDYMFRDDIFVEHLAGTFAIVSYFLMLIITLATRRSKKRIVQEIERMVIKENNSLKKTVLKILGISNFSTSLILFTIWSIPTLILAKISGYRPDHIIIHFCTFFVFTVFALSCSEVYLFLKDSKWKYHILITLFFFIYQGGIFFGGVLSRSSNLLIFSFPGYLISMFPDTHRESISNFERVLALTFNAVISLMLLGGVVAFYKLLWQKKITDAELQKTIKEEKLIAKQKS